MPSRIIKEGICANDQIDQLTPFEETVFYRLIVNADDYGRFDGRLAILRARLFPLKNEKQLKDTDLKAALESLARVDLLKMYKCDGKPYVCLTGWERNQQIRAKKSKYPDPSTADASPEVANGCNESENSCNQSDAPDGEKKKPQAPPEKNPQTVPDEPFVFTLLLNDDTSHGVTASEIAEYRKLYPAVDVAQEFRNMIGWINSNPTKRKTKAGIRRFINSWLARKQNEGGTSNGRYANASNGWNGSGNSGQKVSGSSDQQSRFGDLSGSKKL